MFRFVAILMSPTVLGLMRIDEPTKADGSNTGPRLPNGTLAVWHRLKESSRTGSKATWKRVRDSAQHFPEKLETAKNAAIAGMNQQIPGGMETAKNALAGMKELASDEIGDARRRWLGDGASDTSRSYTPELCTPARDLALNRATTIYSNLGGLGPDKGRPQSLRVANVFPDSGMHIDMLVTAMSKYVGTPAGKNKLAEDFLVVNVNSGSSVHLQFSFVDRITGSAVDVPAFLFTIAGLDHQDGGARQRITMRAHTNVYTSERSGVSVDGRQHWNTTFVSMRPEVAAASKHSLRKARSMSPEHLSRAVALRIPHVSHFEMKLSVDPGMGSRDFYFSGASNMVCDTQATCDAHTCPKFYTKRNRPERLLCRGSQCTDADVETCCRPVLPHECHPASTLMFSPKALHHSNLGGHGPDFDAPPTILFENVFPQSAGTLLDLEVSAASVYAPADASLNGVANGHHGRVSIALGTSADLNFSFYEHGTRRLLKPSQAFYLSFMALDTANGMGVDSIRFPSELVKATKLMHADGVLKSTDSLNRTVFVSDTDSAANETPEVSVLLAARQHFTLTVNSLMQTTSQTLRFSGYSKGACPPWRSLCARTTCPGGHQKRLDAMDHRCAGESCTLEDIGTCCEPTAESICDAKNIVKFVPDSLMESNLGGYGPHVDAPRHMLFSDILPQSHSVVTMRLSTIGNYKMNSVPQNTVTNGYIKLDVDPGSKVHLRLEFFTERDGEPLELPMFYLTVADIDKGFGDSSIESVGITGHSYVNASNGRNFLREEGGGENWSFFSATEYGDERFGPWFDAVHKEGIMTKSLGAFFERVSEVEVVLKASRTKPGNSSRPRSFYISGQTSLACPVQPASCASYVCPAKQILSANSASLSCAGSVCTEADAHICCHDSNEDECNPTQTMVIAPHSVVHSNLCGLGPDDGQQALIYGDVFPGSGRKLDLEILGIRGCAVFDASTNGMHGNIGTISLQAGAVMGLDFTIVDASTRTPVDDIWPYIVTFLNLEAPEDNASSYVEIAVSNLQSYQVTDRTTLRITNQTFRSGSPSSLHGDGPVHPHALLPRHLAKAVALKFDSPSFNVLASVSQGFDGGHNVMFAGSSNLACSTLAFCSTAVCPAGFELRKEANSTTCLGATCTKQDDTTCCIRSECSEERTLQLRPGHVRYSNLGGYGPDRGHNHAIVYADVFPFSGQDVDLEVTAVGEYFLTDAAMNGVDGPFGSVNMGPGTDLTLKFRFVEPGTKTLASVDSFLFSVFNVTMPNEDAQKLVSVSPYKRYALAKYTKLREESRNGKTFFTSEGDEEDWRLRGHPGHPLALGQTQMNHSVTFRMAAKSEFTMSASLHAGWKGTNILFAGASNIMCAERALCISYQCPVRWGLKEDAHRTVCKTQRCNHLDVEQCCVRRSTPRGPPTSHWVIDEDVLLPELPAAALAVE